jgi:dienelactone hydrolase
MTLKRFFFASLLLIVFISASAQIKVPYLLSDPEIDGLADAHLPSFALREFSIVKKSSNTNPDFSAGYYIAYSERLLYFYIEVSADKITHRDRAYQNGDGFHLMIGKPQPDALPTDEFYVLAFSPNEGWSHKMVWYYNVNLGMARLGSETKFKTAEINGKISFELLLPLSEVYPYNPLLSSGIGFNLCFVKAVGQSDKSLFFVKDDNRFQSEQSKRRYEILEFEAPQSGESGLAFRPVKNTITAGESLQLRISGYNSKAVEKSITVRVLSGENSTVATKTAKANFKAGLSESSLSIDTKYLLPGGYKVRVVVDNISLEDQYISVLPVFDFNKWRESLTSSPNILSPGNFNTLMYYINSTESLIRSLKDYESSYDARRKISEVKEFVESFEKGEDKIAQMRGYNRRAYKVNGGDALCPYSVYLPADYSPQKSYPLLVYLHGSGEDDRVLSRTSILPEGFIILAPGGAGTSNCFATVDAQEDINRSISDVIDNFNIDSTRIILSGFSMGGYGVYRTYWENPSRYCAIAILSGHPDLARKWVDKNEINFLEESNLSKFKSVPIFIFHGKNDLNCPFELTERIVEKLRDMGANISFESDNSGHGSISSEIKEKYYTWLSNL